jgi:hypothetical protein
MPVVLVLLILHLLRNVMMRRMLVMFVLIVSSVFIGHCDLPYPLCTSN